jgi:histidine ammonia-lyase
MEKTTIELNGSDLTIHQVYELSHSLDNKFHLKISESALVKMNKSRQYIHDIVESNEPVYGINTGFGALSSEFIKKEDLNQLQLNLIRSHCTGVGEPFSNEIAKAIMILRANCLITGFSGVNPEIVQLLLDFVNNDIFPVIPKKGSVGASGDLAPLSHVALALIGEGEVEFEGKVVSSSFAIQQIGKKPAVLGPKDGLALINGTAVMAAMGAVAIVRSEILSKTADITSALTLDAVRGTKRAFDMRISLLKPHKGQLEVASNLNILLEGSEIHDSHDDCDKVQDPYSLRCIPQVHGACRQTLAHAHEVLQTEINSVTDNPLIFEKDKDVISGGNFHGEAIAMCMDYLAIGMSEFCNISERRVEKMMNPTFSDLPAFLIEGSGLNSGLMIAHVTMAALASENKILCHPASVDSIPTSTDKEDHVSMGITSGRKLLEILDNLQYCLAIELLCNTQALEFLKPHKSSRPLDAVYTLIRKHVEPIIADRVFSKDIEKIKSLINSGEVLKVVEEVVTIQ